MPWTDTGNYPCCHPGCDKEADFIVGTTYDDYTHMCHLHIEEYDNEGMQIIPNIRIVKPKAIGTNESA